SPGARLARRSPSHAARHESLNPSAPLDPCSRDHLTEAPGESQAPRSARAPSRARRAPAQRPFLGPTRVLSVDLATTSPERSWISTTTVYSCLEEDSTGGIRHTP